MVKISQVDDVLQITKSYGSNFLRLYNIYMEYVARELVRDDATAGEKNCITSFTIL